MKRLLLLALAALVALGVDAQETRRRGGIKYTAAGGSGTVDQAGNYTWTGAHDFGGGTLEIPNAASDPATCSVGMIFANTTSGAAAKICTAANTWTALAGIGGTVGTVDNVIPRASGTGGATLDGGSTTPPTYDDNGYLLVESDGTATVPSLRVGVSDTGFASDVNNLYLVESGTSVMALTAGSGAAKIQIPATYAYAWPADGNLVGNRETALVRATAATVAVRGATNTDLGMLLYGISVEVNTTTKSPTVAESGECYTNTGDADGSTVNLPNDPTIGSQVCVLLTVSQSVTVAPAAGETISDAGTAYSTSCVADALGESITLVAATGGSGATWVPKSKVGTWTCS